MNNRTLLNTFFYIMLSFQWLFVSNCAVFLLDEKVDDVKVLSTSLDDFNGYYKTTPIYSSENSIGVSVGNVFDEYGVFRLGKAEYVRMIVLDDKNLELVGIKDGCEISEIILVQNKNFYFEYGEITIGDLSEFQPEPGDPSGHGIGVGAVKMKWIVDEERNLVITQEGGGIGIAWIFPFVAGGKGMTIYQRVDGSAAKIYFNVNCFSGLAK